jgi:hypothetical protein
MMSRTRAFSTVAALLGWFALTLQLILTIQLAVEHGRSVPAALWQWIGYFTITTNILVAVALSASAVGPRASVMRFFGRPDVHSMIAMSIVIVSVIYNLLLRQLWHPHGWQLLADVLMHDVMPLVFLLHWWLAMPKAALRWQQVGAWQIYPAAYFVYALARGAANGWYPYPFLDVATLGYLRVLINAVAILLAFVAVALLLVALARRQAHRLPKAFAH